MKKLALISCLSITMVMFNNCARNPVTGKKQVVFMSEAQELAMGQEADHTFPFYFHLQNLQK